MIQVRYFTLEDQAELVQVIDRVCAEGMMQTRSFCLNAAWKHALIQPSCPCHLLLVAQQGKEIIGWCRVFPAEGGKGIREGDLGIGLLPVFRDRGVGTSMVHYALQWARTTCYQNVRLMTHPSNSRAIRVFLRCGFVFQGSTRKELLEMVCALPESRYVEGENRYGNVNEAPPSYPLRPGQLLLPTRIQSRSPSCADELAHVGGI